jgi:transposase-like protein
LIVLSVGGFFTVEQQRELVHEYLCVPYGDKGRFLAERGITSHRFRRWRKQVFAGTLELGLVPRAGGMVSVEEAAGLKRLLDENRALREQLAADDSEHQRELAAKDEALDVQRRAVDALGKAIEILHQSGERKNSTDSAARPAQPGPRPQRG